MPLSESSVDYQNIPHRRAYTFVQEAFLQGQKEEEMQRTEMLYCPMMGVRGPVPVTAKAWREQHRHTLWVFNPWTGHQRTLDDVQQDPDGKLLIPLGEKQTAEWERHWMKAFRAEAAFNLFRRAGWATRLDAQQLVVDLRKGGKALTFRLGGFKGEVQQGV
jgi:hypothetical protein